MESRQLTNFILHGMLANVDRKVGTLLKSYRFAWTACLGRPTRRQLKSYILHGLLAYEDWKVRNEKAIFLHGLLALVGLNVGNLKAIF